MLLATWVKFRTIKLLLLLLGTQMVFYILHFTDFSMREPKLKLLERTSNPQPDKNERTKTKCYQKSFSSLLFTRISLFLGIFPHMHVTWQSSIIWNKLSLLIAFCFEGGTIFNINTGSQDKVNLNLRNDKVVKTDTSLGWIQTKKGQINSVYSYSWQKGINLTRMPILE